VARSATERNRCIEALGLKPPDKADFWSEIYRPRPVPAMPASPQPSAEPEANPTPSNGTPPSPAASQEPQDGPEQDLNR
jgi:hypothetical protein